MSNTITCPCCKHADERNKFGELETSAPSGHGRPRVEFRENGVRVGLCTDIVGCPKCGVLFMVQP